MATKAVESSEFETDDETKAIIYEGATIRQLAIMFRSDPKVVARKVGGLVPVSRRRGNNIYRVDEAAPRLVKPGYDIERYIREMNHVDLPPLLAKEFWNAQRARQAFEEQEGDLWRTPDVVRALSEAFTTCRMSLLLMTDAVERQSALTDQQRIIIKGLIDGALADMREKLKDRFKDYGMDGRPRAEQRLLGSVPTEDPDAGGEGVPAEPEVEDEYHGL
jgi:hypothetical protein